MSWSVDGTTLLFCPADRPERFQKALAASDIVIIDLEDAVPAENRDRARQNLIDNPLEPDRVVVRVNAADTEAIKRDLTALRRTAYRRVMLPKVEKGADTAAVRDWDIIALCETPQGVRNAYEIASTPAVSAVMWGAEDLVAAMGGRSSRAGGRYRDVALYARAFVLLAASAADRPAIDTIYLDINDLEGLAVEASDAVASGFAAKACIHPRQVDVVRAAFRPDATQVAWAERVIAASTDGGVTVVDGQMIDAPMVGQAWHILGSRPKP